LEGSGRHDAIGSVLLPLLCVIKMFSIYFAFVVSRVTSGELRVVHLREY